MEQSRDRPPADVRGDDGEGPGAVAAVPRAHCGAERPAVYLYGIVEARDVPVPEDLPWAGVTGAPVYTVHTVPSHGLAAIVSLVASGMFEANAPETRLHDVEWVAANAVAHQEVLAWLLARDYAVVPVKFGTLCADADHVQTVLIRHHRHFAATLECVRGAAEWGVTVGCDGNAVTEWVASRDDPGRPRERVVEMPQGAAYLAFKQLEQRVRQEVAHVLQAYARDLHDRLSRLARAAVAFPLPSRESRRDRPTLVLRAAYLVANADVEAFHAAVRGGVGTPTLPGITCETTGPWPPYNFVSPVPESLG